MRKKMIMIIIMAAFAANMCACAAGGDDAVIAHAYETDAAGNILTDEEDEAEASKEGEGKAEAKNESDASEEGEDKAEAEDEADASTDEKDEAEKKASEETKDKETDDMKEENLDWDNITSPEFAKCLKFGWNLGNTLDANASKGLDSETSWGQPKATKELISYLKEIGLTSVRIPVSWANHTDSQYNIDPEWMARVKEVVDYAYDEGMFVIINSHHDADYYYPTKDRYEEGAKYLSTIWTQIAAEFEDYDYHLIFESMNEPRLKDTDIEWWFAASDSKGKDAIVQICKYNQVFVDTIRASQGYNKNRFLMVPSYAANPDYAFYKEFSMPNDPADRLMLSVHAYTPYDFAGNGNGYSEWDGSKTYEFNFMGKLMAEFINKGYGVVIGEFGVTNKDNLEDRCRWARGYCMKAADFGISYFVWDNGATGVGEENFGLIDRQNLDIYYPELFDAYMTGYSNHSWNNK